MFRAFQLCCVFLTGSFLLLEASRIARPEPAAVPAKEVAPKPPSWRAALEGA